MRTHDERVKPVNFKLSHRRDDGSQFSNRHARYGQHTRTTRGPELSAERSRHRRTEVRTPGPLRTGNVGKTRGCVNARHSDCHGRHVKGLEMAERITFELDGERHTAEMAPDKPLLVLRNDAALLSEAGGPPGARPGQALGGAWLGLKGPPSVRRARAALDRDGPIIG